MYIDNYLIYLWIPRLLYVIYWKENRFSSYSLNKLGNYKYTPFYLTITYFLIYHS